MNRPVRMGVALAAVGLLVWGGMSISALVTAQDKAAQVDPKTRLATLAKRAAESPKPDIYFEMGRLQFALGDDANAFRSLAKAVSIAPAGHHSQVYLLHQLDKTRYNTRIELFEALRKILPDYPPLLERLGRLYQGKGEDKKAAALFAKWTGIRPGSEPAHARRAEFARATGQPKLALAEWEKARAISGESDYALRRMGVVHREEGSLERSAELLEAAIDLLEAGDDLVALTELGHTRMAQKRYKDAASAYKKSVALDEESPAYRLHLARAQAAAGDNKGAKASYQKVVALDKFNLEAQLGLGELLIAMGDPKAALPHLKEASSRNDRDPDMHFLVGKTAIAAGDMETATYEHNKLKQIRSVTLAKKLKGLIAAAGGG